MATPENLTKEMRKHSAEINRLAKQRRELWHELNQKGISQNSLAQSSNVTTQVVYMEIRKHKESKQCQETLTGI